MHQQTAALLAFCADCAEGARPCWGEGKVDAALCKVK